MTKNKMEQVAKLFGKELNEEFNAKIKCWNGKSGEIRAKFTSLGLKVKTRYNAWELRNNDYLADLLTGKAEIIND